MIINKINVEGVYSEEEIKNISFKDGNIFDKNIEIKYSNRLKDVIEASLDYDIVHTKILTFKDSNIINITIKTLIKLLVIEDNISNKVFYIEEGLYFNYTLEGNNKSYTKEDFILKIIDCYIRIIDSDKVLCTLTYYIKKEEDLNSLEKLQKEEVNKYRLIDITEEFI